MPDLSQRFRALDEIPVPDLREEMVRRASAEDQAPRSWRAVWTVAVAGLVAAAGIAFAARALLVSQKPAPVGPPAATPAPSPRVTATIHVGAAGSLVFGEGSLWVSVSANDGTTGGEILRIDPGSGSIVASIPVEAVPSWETAGGGLAVGHGSLWVAGRVDTPGGPNSPGGGFDGLLLRVDPGTNEVIDGITLGGVDAADVMANATGIWVSMFGDGETTQVVRISPETDEVTATVPLRAAYARHIFAAGGGVWVHEREYQGADTGFSTALEEIDPSTDRIVATLPLEGEAAVAASDGVIWAAIGQSMVTIDPE